MSETPSTPDSTQDPEEEHFVPRGTVAFTAIMLGGYAVYWAILWFITIIQRGFGGG